jgi:hypothetical protein
MTEEERAEALAALRSPTLYADILRDVEAAGYVGEEHNKAVGYLVGVSRKLDDPLSCSIISQSAAGKSVLADTVERMTPPEDVVSLSRATPQALSDAGTACRAGRSPKAGLFLLAARTSSCA